MKMEYEVKELYIKYLAVLGVLLFLLLAASSAFPEVNPATPPGAQVTVASPPSAPSATVVPKADPGGTATGVAADLAGEGGNALSADDLKSMAKTEPLAAKVAEAAGHNRVSINFAWTLVCGFLVMFMQVGFA